MPPKRIVKNASKPKLPPQLSSSSDGQTIEETTEAELKFDQEVLWCISQFEKLLSTGKLPEPKRQESIKAINTLRKPGVAKIQKIQLMKQFFKDYKSKMLKEESEILKQQSVNFQPEALNDTKKGIFVKKKILPESATSDSNGQFLFNFKDPSEDVVTKLDSMKLS